MGQEKPEGNERNRFHLDSRLVRDRHNGLRGILGSRDGASFPREGGDASQVDAL
jgi:hypothetical protein